MYLVYEELAELECFRCQPACALVPLGLIPEQVQIFAADHGGAGSAGQDDRRVRLKDLNGMLCESGGLLAKTAVVEWLPAAGLLGGEVDLASGTLQQSRGGHADFRHDLIDQAGDEKRYVTGGWLTAADRVLG